MPEWPRRCHKLRIAHIQPGLNVRSLHCPSSPKRTRFAGLRFEAACGAHSDALQKEFSVVEEGLAVPVVRNLPLSEVGSLEPARYPVKLTVYDERMKAYMEGLQRLSAQDGELSLIHI